MRRNDLDYEECWEFLQKIVRSSARRLESQYNDTQQNDTNNNRLLFDTQHNNTQHSDTKPNNNVQNGGLYCDTQQKWHSQ